MRGTVMASNSSHKPHVTAYKQKTIPVILKKVLEY